ncbi:MAG: helix-turn-helix domain-containing protein [Chloroflexi bacterium]|nr:MAG: helix-turn-helix domain-containing protein [Chloroflexota bacterium]
MSDDSPKLLLTVAEAAEALRVGERFTKTLIQRGDLRSLRLGKRRLIARRDLEEFVARLRDGGSE